MTKYVLGIDIGTSFSCVAFGDDSGRGVRAKVLRLMGDKGLVSSVVLYDSDDKPIAFGKEAVEKYIAGNGKNIIREFKMDLGKRISKGDFDIESEDVYETFLDYLKQEIEKWLGEKMESGRVCITHPADESKKIGERVTTIAEKVFKGFKIVSIEESSAVVQFIDQQQGLLTINPQKVLVLDSGGGTTDFSLAIAQYRFYVFKQPLEIIRTGRVNVGGRNVDEKIYEKIKEKLQNNGYSSNPLDREKALRKIRLEKEKYWSNWSTTNDHNFEFGAGISMSSDEFKECVRYVIDEIIKYARDLIEPERESKNPIQAIILAGGNSQIPILKEKLENEFALQVLPVPVFDIQTAIAKGAAIYAYSSNKRIRYNLRYDIYLQYPDPNEKPKLLWKRGEKVPTSKPKEILAKFTDSGDLIIKFKRDNTENDRVLEIRFDPPLKLNTEVKISFDIDANGYLRYTAEAWGKEERRIFSDVIKKYLFDVSPPDWVV
ncbi:MAG: Hsp70 family protein [Ardenticatenaceae bacterium]